MNARSSPPANPLANPVREPDVIEVIGAHEHNLKIAHLAIPKRQFVVLTGPSGSGKSSLAFDTIYAEGQRRYIETLSSYARQFLGQMERPAVDHLRGLSPTIAIEQKSGAGNPRSTVGTITEVHDYLRVLYAKLGQQRCLVCNKLVVAQSVDEIVENIMVSRVPAQPAGATVQIFAPLVDHRKGTFEDLFAELRIKGFSRIRLNGTVCKLDELVPLDKKKKHVIELSIDRIKVAVGDDGRADKSSEKRLAEAVEAALREGQGEVIVECDTPEGSTSERISSSRSCCGQSYPEPSPQSFSFNSPLGMCPDCNGLGSRLTVDPSLLVPDDTLSIRDGAIAPWKSGMERGEGWTFRIADAVAKAFQVDLDTPWKKLPKAKREWMLHGKGEPGKDEQRVDVTWGKEGETKSHGTWNMKFQGIARDLMRRYQTSTSEQAREGHRKYMTEGLCDTCQGQRLRKESLSVSLGGLSIAQFSNLAVKKAKEHIETMVLSSSQQTIAASAVREVVTRLSFLLSVGLDYLSLDRSGPTLSGGEAQRIRLASQLGSELSGVTYVLDEPSIGLHPRDNARLLATLRRLRDYGNTVLVVEHDEETIRAADHLIDFGPGAGHLGGEVLFSGPPANIFEANSRSLTAQYLSGERKIEVPTVRRTGTGAITVFGAAEHNLRDIDVRFPLGVLTAVTGVSGAGKSSLVNAILLPALARALHESKDAVGKHKSITGIDLIDKAIAIDQRPIGRTPRSNPATYTKCFDLIREVYAQLPEAKMRGFAAGRFSFNVKGGRCEACSGDGVIKVEMHFLADVYVPCDVCRGQRYEQQTLAVKFKGKNIAEMLDTSIEEAHELFANHPQIARTFATLVEVGLGYMKLGQKATTLSGGEAQRIKLSRELAKRDTGRTLYVLDEPTTGLHFDDVRRLIGVLDRLVSLGNSVIVIEHHMDVVKRADYVIDLGPEGGAGGGMVIAQGTPEQVANTPGSFTGVALRSVLGLPN